MYKSTLFSYFCKYPGLHVHKLPDIRAALPDHLITPLIYKGIKVIPPAAPKESPTSPAVTVTSPEIMSIVVLFPDPLGPNRPNTSPETNMQELLIIVIFNKTFFSVC